MNTAHDTDGRDAGVDRVTLAIQFARVVARCIDAVIVGVLAFAALLLVYQLPVLEPPADDAQGEALLYLGYWAAAVVVGWGYETVSLATRGKTVGKWVAGVELVAPDRCGRLGLALSMGRPSRQLLLWIVFPLGLLSVWRLVLLERRQTWYDRAAGMSVRWAIPAGSRRRRMWNWPETGPGAWAERHPALVLSAGAGVLFCIFTRPPSMGEPAAVSAIELLVTANVVGLGVFVATSGLVARYNRRVGPGGKARPILGDWLFLLGGASLIGILSGAAYVATQSAKAGGVSPERLVARTLIFLVLAAGVAAMAGTWIAQLEAETEIHDAEGSAPHPEADNESADQPPSN